MNFLARRTRRIWVCGKPADMRLAFLGLQTLIRNALREDPVSGDVFVFINRRGNYVKCFLWDRTGFVIVSKRLERGKFVVRGNGDKFELNERQLGLLFDGVKTGGIPIQS